ncbi:MAG: hypothetical protein JXP72_09465 [Coriobacteriia bacterium]|nr:hypothetical protein [Coriobacteriia bacterium]
MATDDHSTAPVRTHAVIVEPTTLAVVWMNDSAARAVAERGGDPSSATLDAVLPLAETLALSAAVRTAAETGEAQHLHADLVSMTRGSVALVVSVYRLPMGAVLVLAENTWQATERPKGQTVPHRAGRRHR